MPYGTPVTQALPERYSAQYQSTVLNAPCTVAVQMTVAAENDWTAAALDALFQAVLDALDTTSDIALTEAVKAQGTHTDVTPTP